MADFKYINFRVGDRDVPIIFPDILVHQHMAHIGHKVIDRSLRQPTEIVSAGFISSLCVTGVHGKSESLNDLSSRPGDASMINGYPQFHGMDNIHVMPTILTMIEMRHIEMLMAKIKKGI